MSEKTLMSFPLDIKFCRLSLEGCGFPPHFHDYYLFGCLLSGKRAIASKGASYEIGPECLVILNPGTVHSCENRGAAEWICLNVPRSAFYNMPESEGKIPFFDHIVYPDGNLYKKFLHLTEGPANETAIIWFMRKLLRISSARCVASAQISGKIERLCSFLRANITEELSLDEMARHSGLGKFYLIRAFRDATGITPWRYLDTLRVNFGRQMLEMGAPIAQCAMEAGFYDQSHFSRSFKRATGYTPGDYQRQFHPAPSGQRTAKIQDLGYIERRNVIIP